MTTHANLELSAELRPTASTDFLLEFLPNQPFEKMGKLGSPTTSLTTPLAGSVKDRFGAGLDRGEFIVSPLMSIGKEHTLCVVAMPESNTDTNTSVRVEYNQEDANDQWWVLAEVIFHIKDVFAPRQIEISVAGLAGRLCRFRLKSADNNEGPCYITLFRVCPTSNVGRVNALSNYEFRLQNEIRIFSGTAYTHSMYGQSTGDGSRRGIVKTASVNSIQHNVSNLAISTARTLDRLSVLEPMPSEAVYSYALRLLGSLLPMQPPNFFSRAKRLSETKPLRILSICAGAARIEEQILGHCSGAVALTLLDASAELCQRAADRLNLTHPTRRVDCLIGDVNAGLPGDGLFDVIVCVSALHHVADLELVLGQVNQRLTDDGEFWSIGEQIGRNGNRLWPNDYEAANRAFVELPSCYRKNAHTGLIDATLSDKDFSAGCFEGIRSEELEALLEAYLIPELVYKRNSFLWRLVELTYSDNYSLDQPEDLRYLRQLVCAEALHWAGGGRSTELHGVYRKKYLRTVVSG